MTAIYSRRPVTASYQPQLIISHYSTYTLLQEFYPRLNQHSNFSRFILDHHYFSHFFAAYFFSYIFLIQLLRAISSVCLSIPTRAALMFS